MSDSEPIEYDYQADIALLREAAEDRDHDQAQFILKRLLQQLDRLIALAVPIERIQAFLPTFEQSYPEEEWVRKTLLGIVTFGQAPDDNVIQMAFQQDFSQPGAGNFLKAIYDVIQAMQDKHEPQARVGFMVSAVVNANMAELVHYWYAEQPDAWQKVRNNTIDPDTGQPSDAEASQIALAFWTDDDVALLDEDGWMLVADSVEAKFRRMRR